MKVKKRIIKEYSRTPIDDLAGEPVYALKGITDRGALTLYKVFRVESIHDLGNLEYAHHAKIICENADKGNLSLDSGFAEAALKKKFRHLAPSTIAEGPVHMLLGISGKNAKLLYRDFSIGTIRDLAEMRFVKLARNLDYKEKLIKDFEDAPLADLPKAPVYALQGLSARDAGLLKKAFGVETISDLADLKYLKWSKEIVNAAENVDYIDHDFFKERLVKKYETYPLEKLVKAPVSALQGLSKNDEELIYRAFKVKTIGKFADLKYWKWACGIMDLYASTTGFPEEPSVEKKIMPLWIKLLLIPLAVIAFLVMLYLSNYRGIADKIRGFSGASENEHPETVMEEESSIQERAGDIPADSIDNAKEAEKGEYYTVLPGDSLVSISEKLFGSYEKWPEIYKNNRDIISSPQHLYPGQRLKISR